MSEQPPKGRESVLLGTVYGLLVGSILAWLTYRLHPHLSFSGEEILLLWGQMALLYGLLGAFFGLGFAAFLKFVPRGRWRTFFWRLFYLAPGFCLATLPDLGLIPSRVSGKSGFLPLLALAVTVLAAISLILLKPRETPSRYRHLQWVFLGVCITIPPLLMITSSSAHPGHGGTAESGVVPFNRPATGSGPAQENPLQENPPPPVLLLNIDGADLNNMILPMVEAGELPTFAALLREGTWGSLATFEPTLSPIIWTTLVTGKDVDAHGIRHFVGWRLPGISHGLDRFPYRSGLHGLLIPLLQKVPGVGPLRSPYTSRQRRARALWEIIGEHFPVGIYRWLITWPAEKVHGFAVAGGLYAGPGKWHPDARPWVEKMQSQKDDPLTRLALYPADALDALPPMPNRRPTDKELAAYLSPGYPIDRADPDLRLVIRSFAEPTMEELPYLLNKYQPRFTAAAFYSVDAFLHRFAEHHRDGGKFAPAVAERYRRTDAMLGRLLELLPQDQHVLVVSDHGWDFAKNHHFSAPPGLFLAHGPAFSPGKRVDGLSVFDIAPLCLRLLDFPLPEDMPSMIKGTYLKALSEEFRRQYPQRTISTYEQGSRSETSSEAPTLDGEMEKELRSLGYL